MKILFEARERCVYYLDKMATLFLKLTVLNLALNLIIDTYYTFCDGPEPCAHTDFFGDFFHSLRFISFPHIHQREVRKNDIYPNKCLGVETFFLFSSSMNCKQILSYKCRYK